MPFEHGVFILNGYYAECHYTECCGAEHRYTECHGAHQKGLFEIFSQLVAGFKPAFLG